MSSAQTVRPSSTYGLYVAAAEFDGEFAFVDVGDPRQDQLVREWIRDKTKQSRYRGHELLLDCASHVVDWTIQGHQEAPHGIACERRADVCLGQFVAYSAMQTTLDESTDATRLVLAADSFTQLKIGDSPVLHSALLRTPIALADIEFSE